MQRFSVSFKIDEVFKGRIGDGMSPSVPRVSILLQVRMGLWRVQCVLFLVCYYRTHRGLVGVHGQARCRECMESGVWDASGVMDCGFGYMGRHGHGRVGCTKGHWLWGAGVHGRDCGPWGAWEGMGIGF